MQFGEHSTLKRRREMDGPGGQLILQPLGEAVFVALLSLMLALALVTMAPPFVQHKLDTFINIAVPSVGLACTILSPIRALHYE